MLDKICETKSTKRYMTAGDSLFVKFQSNAAVAKQGFRAKFYDHYLGIDIMSISFQF